MSLFKNILQTIKKPIDALKDFLTPKEKKAMEFKVGEGLTPEQRVEAESVLKKPAPDKLPYTQELGYSPYKSPTREMFAQLIGEGPRKSTIPEATKKVGTSILEFGKDVLRATPRAAASVTLQALGTKKMTPETKAEKFLFGKEPIESVGERIERFPERAKEFGIPETTAKKIAPFAILGMTALDIIPPLPGKSVAKGTVKKLVEKYGDDVAEAIIKKGGKELVEKALQEGGEKLVMKAKIPVSFVRTLKYELPQVMLPARGTKPTWKIGKQLWNTMRSGNVLEKDLGRSKAGMSWVIDKLSGGDSVLNDLIKKYGDAKSTSKQYKKLYAMFKAKDYDLGAYKEVMSKLKGIEPMVTERKIVPEIAEMTKKVVKPKTVELAKEGAQAIHSKTLKKGIDEAYYALDKAGKDAVYDMGKVGDYITDPAVKKQYSDILDTPLYIKRQFDMGKAHGSLSVTPKGKPAIVLSDGLTDDMIDRTLVEELTHAKQFKKGITPTTDIPYKEIPEEIRAKKAAKYFAPKTTLEDVIEESLKKSEVMPPSATKELKAIAQKEIPELKGVKAIDLSKPTKELKEVAVGKNADEIIKDYQKHINITPAKKPTTSIKEGLDKAYTAIVDRFSPITKLAKKAGKLQPGEDPEILARRYLGIQGIAESKLFWNTTKLTTEGNLEVTGKGLSKILKPVKNNIDDLRTLMVAQRDVELAERVLPTGKKVIGTTPEKSQQVISALQKKYGKEGFEGLIKTSNEVRDWAQKTLLDPLLEVGALSKEQYETIAKSNKFYVPFQRVIEELETHGAIPKSANLFTPKAVPIKKIKGSEKAIVDPFESLITNTYKVSDFVERARVAKSITKLREASLELAELIKPIKTKIVPVAKQGEELIFRPSFFTPDKNTMMVFENGKRKFYQVPEDVFKAVSGMMEADVGAIIKVLAYPAKLLRAGATLTPEFMGRNPIRDQFTAFVFSKYGYVPGVDLIKGIWNTIGKTDTYGRWLAGGGAHSMFVSLDRITSQATLKKVLGAKNLKGMVKNPVEALRALSEFGEKGTRLGAFERALKKGVTDLEAAFESRDITLDFARRGSQTRAVNMLVAFWNAQVQGLNKMVRAFREKPMQTTFKAVSGLTLPSILLYLHNRNDPRYQELPQWQKDLFWVLPIGDKGPIIRIPKPFEVGIIFGTVPEHILTWIDKNEPEALTSVGKTLMEASAPGYIPTALQPIIENIANYSFFKQRPIVSEGAQNLPKELQAGRYTSETAKEVGKLIKQSPSKIENLIYGYTAGLGKYAIAASDKLLKGLGVVSPPPEPAKTAADIPFIRAFVAREPIGSGSESVNKFYKYYEEANQTKAAVTEMAEKGMEQEAVEYLKKHPAGFYTKGLNKVVRTFSELRKKRDAVFKSRDLTPEQKKAALDALDKVMTEIAKQTVELIENSKGAFNQ